MNVARRPEDALRSVGARQPQPHPERATHHRRGGEPAVERQLEADPHAEDHGGGGAGGGDFAGPGKALRGP